jgi:cyclophilin family peptidyl-prolyl cis-trans isomerase
VAAAVAFACDNAAPLLKPLYCACFLDLAIDGEAAGRLVLELSTSITPKAAENFRAICTGEHGKCKGGAKRSSGVALDLCYRGTSVVRVIPGQFAHGGDLSRSGQYGGSQGESIYGVHTLCHFPDSGCTFLGQSERERENQKRVSFPPQVWSLGRMRTILYVLIDGGWSRWRTAGLTQTAASSS